MAIVVTGRKQARRGSIEKAVLVRTTAEEHRQMKEAAKREGIRVAEWIRRATKAAIAAELAIWYDGREMYVARDAAHAEQLAKRRAGKRKRSSGPFTVWPADETIAVDEGGEVIELRPQEVVMREGRPGFLGLAESAA